MTTRIYHRIDSQGIWVTAGLSDAGKLAKGEIGISVATIDGRTTVLGYLGINDAETTLSACPIVFSGTSDEGVSETVVSAPVIYEEPATTPPSGSTLSWDADNDKWIVDTEVLSLDAYPTVDGAVAWDQSEGKFVVGAAVSAIGIDGGTYTT